MVCNVHNLDMRGLVGLAAADAYAKILLSPASVQRVSVYKYSSPPLLQQRISITPNEQSLIDEALVLRKDTKLPFWNALFAACLQMQAHSPELIKAAFFHNGPGEPVAYDRVAIETGILESLVQSGQRNLGLSSLVQDDRDRIWHLPLLDFHCDISPCNEDLAALICSHLMPDGYVLIDSGDSYHACGVTLLSSDERVHMLGRALLAAPIVDGHYIAHQLQQKASSIRISKGGKASHAPVVVRAWAPVADNHILRNLAQVPAELSTPLDLEGSVFDE